MRPPATEMSLVLFVICLLTACSSAQTFILAEVDEPPLLPLTRKWRHSLPPTAGNRLQSFLYSNLKYPDVARKPGIQANVRASYQIEATGEISNLKVSEVAFDDGYQTAKAIRSDTIILRGFYVPLIDYGHGTFVPPPPLVYTHQDTLVGHLALVKEVERVVRLLPAFQPARRNGKSVAVRKTTHFIFRLE